MIVIITGAYKNAGDHLIGYCAKKLLSEFVDADIRVVDRKNIVEESYSLFNRANAVLLCGGPAYQKKIYPNIYNLDLRKITVPVIPFGLGYKDSLVNSKFEFTQPSLEFIQKIHDQLKYSSARDLKTVDALVSHGINNVLMTGCPVWYDLQKIDSEFVRPLQIKKVVVSNPAKLNIGFFKFLFFVSKKFPDAQKTLCFHHGIYVGNTLGELRMTRSNLFMAMAGFVLGFDLISIKGSESNMRQVYDNADFHLGYRVHAHLYSLSQRHYSVLISEDMRGVSQSISVGFDPILANDPDFLKKTDSLIDRMLSSDDLMAMVALRMRTSFKVMKTFLSSIKG
jgi:hypothetical protein